MRPPQTSLGTIISKHYRSLLFGVCVFTLGLAVIVSKSRLMELLASSVLVLRPNSLLEGLWKTTPVPLATNVYFFNWTNPHEFFNSNTKPKLEQVGPYKFAQHLEKVNVTYNDNDTVSFSQIRTFIYMESNDNGKLSDKITSLNLITLGASQYVHNWNYFLKRGLSLLVSTTYPDINITRTVKDLLIEGYNDIMLDLKAFLPFLIAEAPVFDKFAWFRVVNRSTLLEGFVNMATGGYADFDIRYWNYNSRLPNFKGKCAKVQGSLGEVFSTKMPRTSIRLFVPPLCRELQFDYEEDMEIDGILGYKYSLGKNAIDNGTIIPENKCYCGGDCVPSGILNTSSCWFNFPLYVSYPNFYLADPVYREAVDGMNPSKDKDETYIVIERTTGITLKFVGRLQLNMFVRPVQNILAYENLPEIIFPLLWLQIDVQMPQRYLFFFKIYLFIPSGLEGIGILGMLIGFITFAWVAYKHLFMQTFRNFYKRNKRVTECEEILLKDEANVKEVVQVKSPNEY